jgi:hypothetical protein
MVATRAVKMVYLMAVMKGEKMVEMKGDYLVVTMDEPMVATLVVMKGDYLVVTMEEPMVDKLAVLWAKVMVYY